MDEQRIDTRIYGAQPLTPREDVAGAGKGPYTPPEAVPGVTAVSGSALVAEGAANIANEERERAPVLASMGGAMTQWMGTHVYDSITMPHFDSTDGYSSTKMLGLSKVDFPLDKDQESFLLKTASPEEFQYKLEHLQTQNEAYRAMGDHGTASLLASLIDPGYLAIDMASLGTARLARAAGAGAGLSRAVAGGMAFTGTYAAGKLEQDVSPLSEKMVFANAMINGAATSMFFRAGKLEPKDPAFPAEAMHREAVEVAEGTKLPESHPDFVGPSEVHPEPTNLAVPKVAATGEGKTAVRYESGGSAASDYNPEINLSRAEQHALTQDGRVLSVETVADIGRLVQSVRRGHTVIDADAKAVYLPAEDRVFLIRQNIKPTDDIRGIMLHEYGVHMNAERVLGTEKLGHMLDSIESLALKGNSRAKQAFADVPKNTPLHLVREEALGYYIERNHGLKGDTFVNRMIHGVRESLRKSGLLSLKLSENDIIQLVRKAAKGGEKARKTSFDTTFPYAWHGGPTRGIDQLDTAFIGSGEGNQAFGHGHYITSEKGTALDYRNKEAIRRGINPEKGGLYRVKIKAEEHQFLNLDSKVQSATVAAAYAKLGIRSEVTGRQAYDYLARKLGSQKAASEALYAEGVAGNKYATGRTRHTGDKSSNYVLFHNDTVDMVARYSKGASPTLAEAQKTVAQKIGNKLEWSLHKTMGRFSPKAREIADFLVDDPLNMAGNSVANIQRAVRADLQAGQRVFEDLLVQELGKQGWGMRKRITNSLGGVQAQAALEKEVYGEMMRRNRISMDGGIVSKQGIPEHITKMADALDGVSKLSLSELKRAGVKGADAVAEHSGFITRRWDVSKMETIERALMGAGRSADQATEVVQDAISVAIQRANGWEPELASDVAKSIYKRARAKGYFEDSVLGRAAGPAELEELRSVLTDAGVTGARAQRVLDKLAGKVDEAGKAPYLKHRIDMALDEAITLPDGSQHSIMDMLDTGVQSLTERYLDSVSSQVAFAKKGLTSPTEINTMRKEFLESIQDIGARREAAGLFDNTIAALRGDPVGEALPKWMRISQGVTQMVGLARAAIYQFTEYATTAAQYGGMATVKSAMKELPGFRQMLSDPMEATHLRNILSRNASQDMRIRPYMKRMEDNFEVPMTDAIELSVQQAKQLTPYFNGLKYVQAHQSRMVGNLIVNTFERAASGDLKALKALEEYGLESGIMAGIRQDIATHGMDTALWAPSTWDAVRAPLTKMMDDAVLRNRTGEIPAFAQFSSTGKFIFTFRSFVLGAHNKVLAGTLNRGGFGGLGLLMLYQFPLAYAATSVDNTLTGKKKFNEAQTVAATFSQMGSMGLLSEAVGVAFGNKQQFGSPGTIAIDKAYKMGSAISSGDPANMRSAAWNSVPLLSVIYPLKAIGETLKDK